MKINFNKAPDWATEVLQFLPDKTGYYFGNDEFYCYYNPSADYLAKTQKHTEESLTIIKGKDWKRYPINLSLENI